jgi:hypothetical protein
LKYYNIFRDLLAVGIHLAVGILCNSIISSGICLAVGILCYPAGWDNPEVKGICGAEVGLVQDLQFIGISGIGSVVQR